ncbi:MAG: phosphopyruvate hydratase [Clostridia bacterium]|nr:phosphopyruvate hydratase [Clostridia bacterium]
MNYLSNKPQISKCTAREILDSRGNPTLEATVILNNGTVGTASVPSGASTGIHEAHEKRDGDASRYNGKGVLEAAGNVTNTISQVLEGMCASDQNDIDLAMLSLDRSDNKSELGANATLAVSLATAHAAAEYYGLPLYRYLGGASAKRLPVPMFNILNGGAHASNNVEIQEFMIVPIGLSSFSEALRAGTEIYHSLGKILSKNGYATTVGDEGGYAPDLDSDEDAIELICTAIKQAGYGTDQIRIALDAAASEWYDDSIGKYRMPKRGTEYDRKKLIEYFEGLVERYPIISIEDALDEDDYDGWSALTERLGGRIMLVGDDLFVTNERRLRDGISAEAANSILIKPNQIGTLTETLDVIRVASESGYNYVISHRSGETEDTTIADLAVATNAPFIKSGAPCRTERLAKYNRLMQIESELGCGSLYGTGDVHFASAVHGRYGKFYSADESKHIPSGIYEQNNIRV